jgi:DNA-binding LacI/PurR family transcriptional regulator
VARAFRRSTTEAIGFIASDITNLYSTAAVRGIEMAARETGHSPVGEL